MLYLLHAQRTATAVFEPFLGGLVTADVELPGVEGDAPEVLPVVDPDFAQHFTREAMVVRAYVIFVVFVVGDKTWIVKLFVLIY